MSASDDTAESRPTELLGLTHECNDPDCHVTGFVKTLRMSLAQRPAMDRPAYDLVKKIQDHLDDADQFTDSADAPSTTYIWAIRELMEEFGGRRHRWSHPRCFDCDHSVAWHLHDACFVCGCPRTESEVLSGERDEALDDEIAEAVREDVESCQHEWLDRPESDTRECLICGMEATG